MNGTEGAGRAGRMFGGAGLGSEAKEEVPTPVAQGGMMEGSGISWTSRAGRRQ